MLQQPSRIGNKVSFGPHYSIRFATGRRHYLWMCDKMNHRYKRQLLNFLNLVGQRTTTTKMMSHDFQLKSNLTLDSPNIMLFYAYIQIILRNSRTIYVITKCYVWKSNAPQTYRKCQSEIHRRGKSVLLEILYVFDTCWTLLQNC